MAYIYIDSIKFTKSRGCGRRVLIDVFVPVFLSADVYNLNPC